MGFSGACGTGVPAASSSISSRFMRLATESERASWGELDLSDLGARGADSAEARAKALHARPSARPRNDAWKSTAPKQASKSAGRLRDRSLEFP
mmetsp:Transcript_54187/g.117079  ORF Transcript_54187/g.117079 Transcript_54187/m.117079 type:complete len:94 (+) Transcript_54187:1340-1621(+)